MGGPGHVAILMATRNGARHLGQQLDSILAQSHRDWSLWISDDGSDDATPAILADWQRRHPGRIHLRAGPGRGAAANFLSLLTDPAIAADHVALADQDDVWLPGKLARALARLGRLPAGPALYAARTRIVDEDLRPLGLSPLRRRPPGFRNALVQSLAGGNTMVLNGAARALVCRAPAVEPVSHDWWLYQLLTGAGAHVLYDPEPVLLYRQHGGNQHGANRGGRARLSRLGRLLGGTLADWNARNIAALGACRHLLTAPARADLDRFARIAGRAGPLAAARLAASGIHRQSREETLALWLAALAGRF